MYVFRIHTHVLQMWSKLSHSNELKLTENSTKFLLRKEKTYQFTKLLTIVENKKGTREHHHEIHATWEQC